MRKKPVTRRTLQKRIRMLKKENQLLIEYRDFAKDISRCLMELNSTQNINKEHWLKRTQSFWK